MLKYYGIAAENEVRHKSDNSKISDLATLVLILFSLSKVCVLFPFSMLCNFSGRQT